MATGSAVVVASEAPYVDERTSFALFGDSITQQSFSAGGWGQLLQDEHPREVDVFNRGFSGYNTRWAIDILTRGNGLFTHIHPRPSVVTVFFGANDAALPEGTASRQHIPVEEYRENLGVIVEEVRRQTADCRPEIVLVAPPPVGERVEGERTDAAVAAYAGACVEVAEGLGLKVVPLRDVMRRDPSWRRFLSDGLHLTPAGNAVVHSELSRVLAEAGVGSPPSQHPHHSAFPEAWRAPSCKK